MQSTDQKFLFSQSVVYEAVLGVLPELGFDIVREDKYIARIEAKIGVSAFSWGEKLSVIVEGLDENMSILRIESSLKISMNIAGSHRYQQHFSNITFALAKRLHGD